MSSEPSPQSKIILYQTEDGGTRLQVRLDGQAVWLSLNQLADLFQRDKSVISRHIKNVFEEGGTEPHGNCFKICNSSNRGGKAGHAGHRILPPRRHHLRRLPREIPSGHAIPDLGDAAVAGIHREGIHDGRRAVEAVGWRRVFRRVTGADPRHPVVGEDVLAQGAGPIDFMRISEREILTHAGKVSHEAAMERAEGEFEKFRRLEGAKPSLVEEHFLEAVEQVKRLEKGKRAKRKDPGRD